jgi:hypothetical protein
MGKTYTNCTTCSTSASGTTTTVSTFSLKQGDTCPDYSTRLLDQQGNPVSFEGWTVEVFMYFISCLKSIEDEQAYYGTARIKLLGNQNLCQVKIGDIVGFEACDQNHEEFMLVTDIDDTTNEIIVVRGYGDSPIVTHKKGERVLFFRVYGADGFVKSKFFDQNANPIDEAALEDGTEAPDFSVIGYHWMPQDTSHKGTYFLEFKVSNEGLSGTDGFEPSIRTIPNNKEGYIITII